MTSGWVAPEVLAIVGPTASGKSALAMDLAHQLGGELVNADAMQLYRGMDIGTAKPTPAERAQVPHHVLDVWDVTRTASVADYRQRARDAVADVLARDRVPIVIGGSGLYIRAALDDFELPPTDPAVRERWEDRLASDGSAALHRELARRDPVAASRMEPANARRIVRALEVVELTGTSFAATMPDPRYARRTVQVGVSPDRDVLRERIAARVERMWADGLLGEVRTLDREGLRQGVTASRALGYAQALAVLDGESAEDEARRQTVHATHRYARRQRSWFGRDDRIRWLPPEQSPAEHVALASGWFRAP